MGEVRSEPFSWPFWNLAAFGIPPLPRTACPIDIHHPKLKKNQNVVSQFHRNFVTG